MRRGRGVDRLRRKKQQLDRLRPLSPLSARSLAALAAWYDVELTYSSNAIEGNTLTRSETAIVLEKGLTIGGKPLKDHLGAIGHRDALAFVRALAAAGEPLHFSSRMWLSSWWAQTPGWTHDKRRIQVGRQRGPEPKRGSHPGRELSNFSRDLTGG